MLKARAASTPAEFNLCLGQNHYFVLASDDDGSTATHVIDWLNDHMRR